MHIYIYIYTHTYTHIHIISISDSPDEEAWIETHSASSVPIANISCLQISICACHPCAGAMLIFSVSFQF